MVQEKGKYTVITGASSGIGYETAKAFAGRGKNLVIAARRTDNLEMLNLHVGLYHCSHGSDVLCGEVLCQRVYRACIFSVVLIEVSLVNFGEVMKALM